MHRLIEFAKTALFCTMFVRKTRVCEKWKHSWYNMSTNTPRTRWKDLGKNKSKRIDGISITKNGFCLKMPLSFFETHCWFRWTVFKSSVGDLCWKSLLKTNTFRLGVRKRTRNTKEFDSFWFQYVFSLRYQSSATTHQERNVEKTRLGGNEEKNCENKECGENDDGERTTGKKTSHYRNPPILSRKERAFLKVEKIIWKALIIKRISKIRWKVFLVRAIFLCNFE